MEMIPEETAVAPATEGLGEPTPAQGVLRPPEQPDPMGSAGTLQERTLPGATGQPQPGSEPPGDAEQPGPGAAGQPSSTEAEPPPSPYLTPDFGKEDPFEILGKAAPPPQPPVLWALSSARWRWHPGTTFLGVCHVSAAALLGRQLLLLARGPPAAFELRFHCKQG